MIRLPSKRTVERLQSRVSGGFYEGTAVIVRRTISSYDDYGQPVYTDVEDEVRCSFTDKLSAEALEQWKPYADIESIQAEIRFTGDKPAKGDVIKLKSRFDRENYEKQRYTEQQFEIVGIRDRDVFGYVCALKEVQI